MPKVSLDQRTGCGIGRLRAVLIPLGGGKFGGELLLRLLSLIYAELYPLKLRNEGRLLPPHIGRFRHIFRGRQDIHWL